MFFQPNNSGNGFLAKIIAPETCLISCPPVWMLKKRRVQKICKWKWQWNLNEEILYTWVAGIYSIIFALLLTNFSLYSCSSLFSSRIMRLLGDISIYILLHFCNCCWVEGTNTLIPSSSKVVACLLEAYQQQHQKF